MYHISTLLKRPSFYKRLPPTPFSLTSDAFASYPDITSDQINDPCWACCWNGCCCCCCCCPNIPCPCPWFCPPNADNPLKAPIPVICGFNLPALDDDPPSMVDCLNGLGAPVIWGIRPLPVPAEDPAGLPVFWNDKDPKPGKPVLCG